MADFSLETQPERQGTPMNYGGTVSAVDGQTALKICAACRIVEQASRSFVASGTLALLFIELEQDRRES